MHDAPGSLRLVEKTKVPYDLVWWTPLSRRLFSFEVKMELYCFFRYLQEGIVERHSRNRFLQVFDIPEIGGVFRSSISFQLLCLIFVLAARLWLNNMNRKESDRA